MSGITPGDGLRSSWLDDEPTPAPAREAVAWQARQIGTDVWVPLDRYTSTAPFETRPLYASPVVPVSREKIAAVLASAFEDYRLGAAAPGYPLELFQADAILAALRPTDTGWQDIATAPKDGTDVLVCDDETGEGHVSYWTGDCWSGRNRFKPTHWMPLHPAPTDTGRE